MVARNVVAFSCVVTLNDFHHPFCNSDLPPLPFGVLLVAAMMNHAEFCLAQYLRAHKAEPLLWLFIFVAILTAGSVFLLAKAWRALGVSAGYLSCCVVQPVLRTRKFLLKLEGMAYMRGAAMLQILAGR